jgi:hypothetical protein
MNRKSKRTAFVPSIVFRTIFVGVVPACASGCSGELTDNTATGQGGAAGTSSTSGPATTSTTSGGGRGTTTAGAGGTFSVAAGGFGGVGGSPLDGGDARVDAFGVADVAFDVGEEFAVADAGFIKDALPEQDTKMDANDETPNRGGFDVADVGFGG